MNYHNGEFDRNHREFPGLMIFGSKESRCQEFARRHGNVAGQQRLCSQYGDGPAPGSAGAQAHGNPGPRWPSVPTSQVNSSGRASTTAASQTRSVGPPSPAKPGRSISADFPSRSITTGKPRGRRSHPCIFPGLESCGFDDGKKRPRAGIFQLPARRTFAQREGDQRTANAA